MQLLIIYQWEKLTLMMIKVICSKQYMNCKLVNRSLMCKLIISNMFSLSRDFDYFLSSKSIISTYLVILSSKSVENIDFKIKIMIWFQCIFENQNRAHLYFHHKANSIVFLCGLWVLQLTILSKAAQTNIL